ncbi:MAG TPA: Uma2 family endonuclease [Kofleriaceae bacterium]|nr:Uma2 family endonuclease [Kofleriaceae bacterium]
MRRSPSATAIDDIDDHLFLEGQRIVLEGISYDDYVTMNDLFVDRPGVRFAYLDGTLEIMSPGFRHGGLKTLLARLLELYALESGIPIYGYGQMTKRKKRKKVGVEPDECYYVGASHRRYAQRGRAPDLAIEIVHSHGMRKIEIYRRLGVREVWVIDKGGLTINALWGERYIVRPKSRLFPDLDVAVLMEYAQLEDQDDAVRAFWALLRRA